MKSAQKTDEDPNDFQLNKFQIKEMIRLAGFRRNDVFVDLGSGNGGVVIEVVKNTPIRKAIGIEKRNWYYNKARKNAFQKIHKVKDLERIDFWKGSYYNDDMDDKNYLFNLKEATVVFASIVEGEDDMDFYKDRLDWKKVRIIKKDIPLVGVESISNRTDPDCWFFLMKFPFKRVRLDDWIKSVSNDFDTLDDLYGYYYGQWYNRIIQLGESEAKARKEATSHLLNLETLVTEKF